ncbi:E3 ubiquitin-protein ligase WAV3-like isoform X1 [Primulina huaijiensis]|uniref:E3 ubiquitin-protein ligase WAV3-like isoform X1 n=1 Tax=Primulina huaijiensis TaxID=1492673 RepID=UPI003CC76FEB
MSGKWSKLKKTLSINATGTAAAAPSSKLPPTVPDQSKSRPPTSSSSSFFSSRLSSSFSLSSSSKKICAICLGIVKIGLGQAIFTAECSHSFHFSCISSSVKHGNHLCPICRLKWKEIPSQLPDINANVDHNTHGQGQVSPPRAIFENHNYPRAQPEPSRYSDDEPLPVIRTDTTPAFEHAHAPSSNLVIKAFPEFPAVAAAESVSDFAVLVGVRAPPLLDATDQVDRASIDLVLVLDVSGSMDGAKLFLMKRAVYFIIENLGPGDRLSLVSFSSSASRIFPLLRMTDTGREDAKQAVTSLDAGGGTNIIEGLKKGIRVLNERRERNSVASIILLSDGKDTYHNDAIIRGRKNQNSSTETSVLNILLASVFSQNGEPVNDARLPTLPIHTFGFGADHDSSAMNGISDASGGTFSFIETVDTMREAFARCIGGLLSVSAQELRLTVSSASSGVRIRSISSGRYAKEISEGGLIGLIHIGDMYADEEKEFLVSLSIPPWLVLKGDEWVKRMSLLKITCSFKDTVSKVTMQVEGVSVEVSRPKVLSLAENILSLEVDRQRNRLWVADGISEARAMADAGNFSGAQAVLSNRMSSLLSSASAQAGDSLCSWLQCELMEVRERMANMDIYNRTGRSYVLSGISSHSLQRATTRGDSGNLASLGYETPSMVGMVSKSQNLSLPNPP